MNDSASGIVVETDKGSIEGLQKDGILWFRGIPYAKPPVGELRFAAPVEREPWNEVYDATRLRNIAPQTPSPRQLPCYRGAFGDERQLESEDCLYLNVTTKSLTGSRPVLVYIHGGANLAGRSYQLISDPAYLVDKGGVVHVSVDFRTGIFGFLYHPALSVENRNTLDQLAALRWVRNNIAAFGGDPENVTVIGQSSGAHNIVELITTDEAGALVKNAVIQSASFGRGCVSVAHAIRKSEMVFRMLGVDIDQGGVPEQMARFDTHALMEVSFLYATNHECADEWGYQWGAVHDDRAEPAAAAMVNGYLAARNGIHVLVGHTENEAGSFRPYDPTFGPKETERVFSKHMYVYANAVNKCGGMAWAYCFGWFPSGSPYQACHSIDQPFTYGTYDAVQDACFLRGADPETVSCLTEALGGAVLSMAYSGKPDATEKWSVYTSDQACYRYFNGTDNPIRLWER